MIPKRTRVVPRAMKMLFSGSCMSKRSKKKMKSWSRRLQSKLQKKWEWIECQIMMVITIGACLMLLSLLILSSTSEIWRLKPRLFWQHHNFSRVIPHRSRRTEKSQLSCQKFNTIRVYPALKSWKKSSRNRKSMMSAHSRFWWTNPPQQRL